MSGRHAKPELAAAAGHGHGHGHGHEPPPPASQRVKRLLTALVVPFGLAAVAGVLLLYPFSKPVDHGLPGKPTPVYGTVTATKSEPCDKSVHVGEPTQGPQCVTVTVKMSDGPAAGTEIGILEQPDPSRPHFAAGDNVVLSYGGGPPADATNYVLVDFQRGTPMWLLAALFAVAVLVLGRWKGLAALVALGLSFVVIVLFMLPAILAGENPLWVAVTGAGVIMFVVLYLTHGTSARTTTAVLGTMISLALIGVLGAIFTAAAKLTGIDDSADALIRTLGHSIDGRGLLLAGIVIGALGVLDDVTVTQASAVWELRAANPSLSWRELYAAGLRIGRDHVGSAVNTLVMAYAGAALPVLLYSSISGVGLGAILGSQSIAEEIVRTLVGSIGLVACVPITTALAAVVASQEVPRTG